MTLGQTLEGKVALITGAGRGLGRMHALRLAEEGADIVALELGRQIDTVAYPMGTGAELDETRRLVEKVGGRIVAVEGDVRNLADISAAAQQGVDRFGRLDIVIANAGIGLLHDDGDDPSAVWANIIDVNLTGVWNTVMATKQHIIDGGRGGSIVLISSTAGLVATAYGSAGADAYVASKTGVIGLMRSFAHELGPHSIRVNTVNPTGTDTPMTVNEGMTVWAAEHSDNAAGVSRHLLPVSLIESADVSNAIVWLVSDAARYVTGITLPVDAGRTAK